MKRTIYEKLKLWKERPDRKPLIIDGARQVGKTFIVNEFGNNEFVKYAYFNFDGNKQLINIFNEDLNVDRILTSLSAMVGFKIDPAGAEVVPLQVRPVGPAMAADGDKAGITEVYLPAGMGRRVPGQHRVQLLFQRVEHVAFPLAMKKACPFPLQRTACRFFHSCFPGIRLNAALTAGRTQKLLSFRFAAPGGTARMAKARFQPVTRILFFAHVPRRFSRSSHSGIICGPEKKVNPRRRNCPEGKEAGLLFT